MIVIIEDNIDINGVLSEALQNAGYQTESFYNGLDAIEAIQKMNGSYDLILLDMMLPYKSGDQILKEIRKTSQIPVIIISAKDLISTKVEMLKLGADDYITKPFNLDEVIARVETNLRRIQTLHEEVKELSYGNLHINTDSGRVYIDRKEVDLTGKEYGILVLMLTNPEKVFTKANIYESVWKEEYLGDDNTIKIHMSNLRNKLKKVDASHEYIETVWGLGYRLKK